MIDLYFSNDFTINIQTQLVFLPSAYPTKKNEEKKNLKVVDPI